MRTLIAAFLVIGILFAQAGTGAISILDFKGVDPTGATDSTAGIQEAIAKAISTGRVLDFPAGVYLCNTVRDGVILNILANANTAIVRGLGWAANSVGGRIHGGITIRGAGTGRTIIKTTVAGADLMAAISSSKTTYYPQYSFEGFTLQGPDTTPNGDSLCLVKQVNGVGGNGLRISGTNVSRVTIRDVNSEYFCGPGKAALWLDTAEEFRLFNVSGRFSDIGLKLTTDTNAGVGIGVKLDSNLSYGGLIELNTGTTLAGLEVQGNCKNGLLLRLVGSMTLTSPYFEHNGYCKGGPWHGLIFNRVTDSYIAGLAVTTRTDDIYLDGTDLINGKLAPVNSRNHISIGGPSAFQAGAKITLAGKYSSGNVWENALPSWFASDPTATETLINPVAAFSAAPSAVLTPSVQTHELQIMPRPYTAIAPRCTAAQEGTLASVSDSNTKVPGAAIAGGGSNHVLAYCDGANWIVAVATARQ